MRWEAILAAIALALAFVLAPHLAEAQTFPALTGRVVDAANILKPDERAALDAKLKAHEDKTSDQVVVATVPSLEGFEIEDYANRLFRQWKLGQTKTNNGALLLVAPKERKVRIEVGYGLEGALTDALSRVIIATAIAPQFQKGDYAAGINAGIDGMLSILTGDAEEWQRRAQVRNDDTSVPISLLHVVVMIIVIVLILRSMRRNLGGAKPPDPKRPLDHDRLGTGRGLGRRRRELRRRRRRVFGRRRLVRRRRRFGELVGT